MIPTVDATIKRIRLYLAETGISMAAAGARAGVSENTARTTLRQGRGRIETLRKLSSIVPDNFVHGAPCPCSRPDRAVTCDACAPRVTQKTAESTQKFDGEGTFPVEGFQEPRE